MASDILFEIGDEVDWCGARGTVCGESIAHGTILVHFPGSYERWGFYKDGRHVSFHTKSSLQLINRPIQEEHGSTSPSQAAIT